MKQPFRLTEAFLAQYKDMNPQWGFNGLSELTFWRTYGTRNDKIEQWWEVCKRVVEGCYNLQKEHIENSKLGWNAWKAQKCLPKDTLIHLENGLKPIEDVQINDIVQTIKGKGKIINKWVQGKQKTITLNTDFGKLECTENHRIAIFSNDLLSWEFKKAKDIKIGDRIVFDTLGYTGIKTNLPHDNGIDVPELNEDLAWLIGEIHGDGTVQLSGKLRKTKNRKTLKPQNGYIKLRIEKDRTLITSAITKAQNSLDLFGHKSTLNEYETFVINLYSNDIADYFYKYIKQSNKPLIIPEFIISAKQSIRAAYLIGLFDADGSCKTRPLKAVTTIYKNFAYQIESLYRSLGICAFVKLNSNKQYDVLIKGYENIKKFEKIAGLYSTKYIKRQQIKTSKQTHSFPIQQVRSYFGGWDGENKDLATYRITERKGINFKGLPVEIKSVSNGRLIETYDIEVENLKQFTANGFVVHNSAQEMYDRMFAMKFLPPGRGLWAMGSSITEERGLYAALYNCFTGDEEYLTRYGYKDFEHTKYTDQEILTENGEWKFAYIKPFGLAEIVELKLKRQGKTKIIRTTANHRWFAKSQSDVSHNKGWQEYTTEQLKEGYRLRYNFGQTANRKASPIGIQHGFIFGDGTTQPNNGYLHLQKGKDENILKYFSNHEITEHDTHFYISSLPKHFKQLPETRYDTKYLYGFCAGYFAADGSVTIDGQISISSANKNHLEKFQELCAICGIGSYEIRLSTESNYSEERELYQLTLMSHTLSEDFFLLSQHKANFKKKTKIPYWNVVSVKNTGEHEQVYCAIVPEKESFTLKDHIFTKNCAFVSTENIKEERAKPFCFLMDMLMLGCFAPDTYIMTAEGPRQIIDLVGNPFVAVVDSAPYLAPFGSWNTGYKDLYKISTKEGFEIKLTDNHLIQRSDNSWLSVDTGLQAGDQIVINDQSQVFFNWKGQGTYTEGYLSGIFVGDGYFSGHHANACVYETDDGYRGILKHGEDCVSDIDRRSDAKGWRRRENRKIQELTIGSWIKNFGITNTKTKTITKQVEQASKEFYIGFLKGLFDADGTVIDTEKTKDIRLTQSSFELLQATQRMLLRLGIYSTINIHRKEDEIHTIQGRKVNAKKSWYLKISKDSVVQYYETIGFEHTEKAKKLKKMVKNNNFYSTNFVATISSIEYIGKSDVYDVNVQEKHAVDANGIMAHNCGVGFDVSGAGKIDVKGYDPERTPEIYNIPDTREGWVESVRLLIESYLLGLPEVFFEYDNIRPAGEPIKGFGGTASGSEPLIDLHREIRVILDAATGQPLRVKDIVDIMNLIGCCVVAGNVRRSSEIALGIEDSEFLDLKNYDINPERAKYGWASNNTVIAKIGQDYTHIAKRIANNGEPGLFWIENAQTFGRVNGDDTSRDKRIQGLNPCQPDWATVLTPYGIKQIKDINISDEIWSGKQWTKVINKWCTGTNDVYAYHTNAGIFYGTNHHRVVSNGEKIEVKDADSIDIAVGETDCTIYNDQDVMDGLVIGDGGVHKASNNLVGLYIGNDDQDYFDSEISDLIIEYRPSIKDTFYTVKTTITHSELPYTYQRSIPDRFKYGEPIKKIGFLRGLYSANGSICGNRITLKSTSIEVIRDTQLMLSSLGIVSYFTTNKSKDVDFSNGTYTCKESYDLNISTDRNKFFNLIGFIQQYKLDKLNKLCEKNKKGTQKTNYEITKVEYISTEDVWDITVEADEHTYWTGGLLVSNCGEITLESYELCVAANTRIHTINGMPKIKNLEGKITKIWNGNKWTEVPIFKTKTQARILRTYFSDGSYLDTTDYHGFSARTKTQLKYKRIQAKDLKPNMVIEPFELGATDTIGRCKYAYEYGFFTGDGYIDNNRPMLTLHDKKKALREKLNVKWLKNQINNIYSDPEFFRGSLQNILKLDLAYKLKDLNELPDQIFTWCKTDILEYIGGYIDADGSVTNINTDAEGYRLYGSEGRLRDIQFLLRRIGINHASINFFAAAGEETNYGIRNYDLWYIQIPSYECKEIPTKLRIIKNFSDGYRINPRYPNGKKISLLKNQKVIKQEFIGYEDTYCFFEPELNKGVFGNVLTYQCNLVETFPSKHESLDDYKRTLKFAYLYSKTVTLTKTHWTETNRVIQRNRRVGCSISGIATFLATHTINEFKTWMEEGYKTIQYYDELYSDWLVVRPSIKTTTIKPSGTISLVAAETAGMHYPESRFFIRRIRMSKFAPILNAVKKAGYHIEDDLYSKNTVVVEVPVDIGEGVRTINEVSMWEQLHLAALIQKYWADNAVSCTVTIQPEEFKEIPNALDYFQYHLKAVSFLPKTKKGAYKQMPNEEIDEATYKSMVKKLKSIDFSALDATFYDETAEMAFCDSEKCELPK